jgi:hypothetical protein
MRFMYPGSKRGSIRTTSDLLPFYAYLNHLFWRTMTPREEDSSNIPSYNRNILVAMAPRPHGFEFSVFDFIWGEIKAISESPLKSCVYALYIMHMIERVTGRTFGYDKEHHSLWIKNDLRAPMEQRGAAAPHSSSPRAALLKHRVKLLTTWGLWTTRNLLFHLIILWKDSSDHGSYMR